jgi:hypothetical protein
MARKAARLRAAFRVLTALLQVGRWRETPARANGGEGCRH